ncbi:ATP synthase subunit A [Marichromatium purpuratum 984]|uniref:ATP synthase subunit A n=1 Tax=Marichromatium purpuratum 984 TaxID=765910 RepID=W0DYT7_MARPU|nr:hypothetical protein [Marichromatium purpuratum]AHF03617.1 ATP synthase subunit A [Marichromatium purpuratum 984]
MTDSHRYAMLLSALPAHGALFTARQTPLSRIRLEQRLTQLDAEDARTLRTLRTLLEWAEQDPHSSDQAVLERARRQIPTLPDPFARDLADWRLEMRTLICALRRRHRGEPPPSERRWGYGRWTEQVRRHWNEPAFRLERACPWLPEAARRLDQSDAIGVERLLLRTVWEHLERRHDGHHFDFAAVIIYALRWDLVARWTSYHHERALARFDDLVETALDGVEPIPEAAA